MPYFNNCTNGIWATKVSRIIQGINPKKFIFNNITNVAIQIQDDSLALFNGGTGPTGPTGVLSNPNIEIYYSPVAIMCKSSNFKAKNCNLHTVRYGIVGQDNSYIECNDSYINGMYGANSTTHTKGIYLDSNSCGVAFGISAEGFSGGTAPGATNSYYTTVNNSLLLLSQSLDISRVQTSTIYSTVSGSVSLTPTRIIGVDNFGVAGGGVEVPGGHP